MSKDSPKVNDKITTIIGRKTNILAEQKLSTTRKATGDVPRVNERYNRISHGVLNIKIRTDNKDYLEWKQTYENPDRETKKVIPKLVSKKSAQKSTHPTSSDEYSDDAGYDIESNIYPSGPKNTGLIPLPTFTIENTQPLPNGENVSRMPPSLPSGLEILIHNIDISKIVESPDLPYDQVWYKLLGKPKRCCNCFCEFTNNPAVMPYAIQKTCIRNQSLKHKITEDTFLTKGCYCSFNCVISDVERISTYEKHKIKEMTYDLASIVSKQKIITPAPPKELLKVFGGVLEEHEYQKLLGDPAIYELNYPTVIFVGSRISRIKNYEHKNP